MASKRQYAPIPYQIVRGFPCPASERFTEENIQEAMDFAPEDGDLVVASYPKTGTTWLQYIVLQITSKGELFPPFEEATRKFVPYIEMVGVAAVRAQGKPRLYKHHIAYDFVQKNEKSKTLYTYRHPEDTVVSYYHFLRGMRPETGVDFDAFFDSFVSGSVSYGSYFRHVLSFYERVGDGNLLMVSYEKLHADARAEVLRIAEFMGEEHRRSLLEDPGLLDGILERTSFDYMKKNLSVCVPDNRVTAEDGQACDGRKVDFFRKGTVGDGRVLLTENQRGRLREACGKVLNGTSIINEWYPVQNGAFS